MKKWAVGFISFSDNELWIEIIEAESWQEALKKHKQISIDGFEFDMTSLEAAKADAFDQDAMINVVEIK